MSLHSSRIVYKHQIETKTESVGKKEGLTHMLKSDLATFPSVTSVTSRSFPSPLLLRSVLTAFRMDCSTNWQGSAMENGCVVRVDRIINKTQRKRVLGTLYKSKAQPATDKWKDNLVPFLTEADDAWYHLLRAGRHNMRQHTPKPNLSFILYRRRWNAAPAVARSR